jgi:hypothetical protein
MGTISKKAAEAFRQWGRNGGKKRAQRLSVSRRKAISVHAARKRWGRASVRLERPLWDDPVYLEEILSFGGLSEWKELHRIIADRPFGAEADALKRVLDGTHVYGATPLWKGVLRHLQGG